MTNVEEALANLRADGERYTADKNDNAVRQRLIANARSLIAELETPNELIMRSTWAEPARNVAMTISLETGLFKQLAQLTSSGEAQTQGVSATKLSEVTNVEKDVVTMVMRHLAAMYLVRETGPDHFAPTQMSTRLMEVPAFTSGVFVGVDLIMPTVWALRDVLKEHGWKNTTSVTASAVQRAHNMDMHVYPWLIEKRPELAQHFHTYMTGYRLGVPKWFNKDFYPVRERMAHPDLNETSTLLVDIGGGFGADITEFEEQHGAALPGRIVLQDLPPIIEGAKASGKLPKRIEPMVHDFMTPEPVKGARAYHMHSILHNWPDKEGHIILQNIRDVMKPGFSKLFIFEHVLPDQNASWSATSEDYVMRGHFSSKERTKDDWRELLKPHGLEIVKIWTAEGAEESLVEAMVAA